jgi:hypothetical protein
VKTQHEELRVRVHELTPNRTPWTAFLELVWRVHRSEGLTGHSRSFKGCWGRRYLWRCVGQPTKGRLEVDRTVNRRRANVIGGCGKQSVGVRVHVHVYKGFKLKPSEFSRAPQSDSRPMTGVKGGEVKKTQRVPQTISPKSVCRLGHCHRTDRPSSSRGTPQGWAELISSKLINGC